MTRDITGTIDGDTVRIRSAYGEQHGDSVNLTFSGKVTGDEMSGTLDMGEYLGATWTRHASRGAEGLMSTCVNCRFSRTDGRKPDAAQSCAGFSRTVRSSRLSSSSPAPCSHRRRRSPRSPQLNPSTTCCCAAATSSTRATRSARVRDVAIAGGKIAAVAAAIDPADALKTVDVSGLYVTPGLIDIHAHVYTGTGEPRSYAGDNSVYPDGFTLRVGVTTVADAGCSGWRNFDDFKQRVIDRSKTRVLAFLNIVGNGMRGGEVRAGPRGHGGAADRRHGAAASRA